jgi:hypothetical protein
VVRVSRHARDQKVTMMQPIRPFAWLSSQEHRNIAESLLAQAAQVANLPYPSTAMSPAHTQHVVDQRYLQMMALATRATAHATLAGIPNQQQD